MCSVRGSYRPFWSPRNEQSCGQVKHCQNAGMEVLWAVTPVTYEFIIPEVLLSVSQLTKIATGPWDQGWAGCSTCLFLLKSFLIDLGKKELQHPNPQTSTYLIQWSLQSSKEFQPEERCHCWEPITHLGDAALSRLSKKMAKPTSAQETACLSKMLLSGRVVVHALFKQCPKLNSVSLSGPLDSSCLTLAVWKFGSHN